MGRVATGASGRDNGPLAAADVIKRATELMTALERQAAASLEAAQAQTHAAKALQDLAQAEARSRAEARKQKPHAVQHTLQPGDSCVIEYTEDGRDVVHHVIARPCPASAPGTLPPDLVEVVSGPGAVATVVAPREDLERVAREFGRTQAETTEEENELRAALDTGTVTIVPLVASAELADLFARRARKRKTRRLRWLAVIVEQDPG